MGILMGCLLVPMTASGMTFDSDEPTNEAPSNVAAPTGAEQPATPSHDAKAALQAMAGEVASTNETASTEEAEVVIGANSRGERGLLSWIALALLGIGAFGSLLLLKKKNKAGGANAAPGLELVQSIRLGAKHQVSLVKVPGATLVLGVTEKGIQTLAELPQMEEPNPAEEWIQTHERKEAPVQQESVSEAPNPFLDKVLNMTQRKEGAQSNPFLTGAAPSDSERRAVLKRLEQYRQGI